MRRILTEEMNQKTEEITRLNGIYKRLLSNDGVKLFEGEGKLVGPNEVEVTQLDGMKLCYSARHVLIATGSRAQRPNIPGQEELQKHFHLSAFHHLMFFYWYKKGRLEALLADVLHQIESNQLEIQCEGSYMKQQLREVIATMQDYDRRQGEVDKHLSIRRECVS